MRPINVWAHGCVNQKWLLGHLAVSWPQQALDPSWTIQWIVKIRSLGTPVPRYEWKPHSLSLGMVQGSWLLVRQNFWVSHMRSRIRWKIDNMDLRVKFGVKKGAHWTVPWWFCQKMPSFNQSKLSSLCNQELETSSSVKHTVVSSFLCPTAKLTKHLYIWWATKGNRVTSLIR